jgi:hypothetical protein
VITLESQPFGRPHQEYRIFDAADGLLEVGTVQVADMVSRQPWLSADDVTIPVDVTFSAPRRESQVFPARTISTAAAATVDRPRPRPQPHPRPRPQPRRPELA